ncbi:hypothetical protein HG66A1_19670 [Gimesia chilikensis]|uniref:Tll0287-like domain-containing protein n=1 Tax=Gimesia chilikensis TaxID=2605989 RepID=A0A517PLE0_9PLAN|nr:hypothetical protein HG66A1_19670 [Gimesia chilikensis]
MQTGRRKRLSLKFMLQAGILLVILSSLFLLLEEVPAEESQQKADPPRQMQYPTTAVEARVRARILHETVHGALQVIHRDFFEEEESRVIPSHSLEDVFKELKRSQGIKVRWLAVNARAMNVDNEPRTEFEKQAVKVLSAGKDEFEQVTDKEYQFTGSIRLASQCLKCHLPMRKSNEARVAGLVISMPLKAAEKEK